MAGKGGYKLLKPLPGRKPKPPRLPTALPLENAPPGRPISNIGQYLIKPTPNSPTGYEVLNAKPDLIKEVNNKYLKAFELPPALQPKYLRKPEVLDQVRSKNISRGWRKPRSLQG